MHANVNFISVDDDRLGEALEALTERVIPDLRQRPGFVSGCWLAAVDGTGMTITLWTDERAAQEAAENLSQHGALPPGVTITRQESRAVVAVV
jgi:hypothetical protein